MTDMRNLLIIIAITIVGCQARTTPRSSEAAERRSLEVVAISTPFSAIPPQNARMQNGVASLVLADGFGTAHPQKGLKQLIGVGFVSYDATGKASHTPFVLQEFDASRPEWQAVFGEMVAGEIRRVWLPENGKLRVYDVQLQSIGESPER